MDTPARLLELADDLEGLAHGLFAMNREGAGHGGEEHTRELARSVAYWMVTLRRLAASGPGAWAAIDARFEPSTEKAAASADNPAEFVAELDVITAFIVGDMVLDGLAHGELYRRGKMPTWTPGKKVPELWPKFMDLLDAEPSDPMAALARYLDLTLVHARDVLVAHRDPTLWSIPTFMNDGSVLLHRAAIEPERRAAAMVELEKAKAGLGFAWGETDYQRLLDFVVELAGRLDPAARASVKNAYRLAGFDAPPISRMVETTIRLLRLHAEAIDQRAPTLTDS